MYLQIYEVQYKKNVACSLLGKSSHALKQTVKRDQNLSKTFQIFF